MYVYVVRMCGVWATSVRVDMMDGASLRRQRVGRRRLGLTVGLGLGLGLKLGSVI